MHLTAKWEVSSSSPASYLCWNTHAGKATGCYAGHIHWQRCYTRGESQGMYITYMSYFAYACKIRCPLNLVLENSEYLWFYSTFCIVILDYGLKLHKLSNHILVILQKWLEIHLIIVWSSHCILFSAIFATEKFQKIFSTLSLKLNYWSPRHQTAVFKVLISFKCS